MNYVLIMNIIDMIFKMILSISMLVQNIIVIYKLSISKRELNGKELIITMLLNVVSLVYCLTEGRV